MFKGKGLCYQKLCLGLDNRLIIIENKDDNIHKYQSEKIINGYKEKIILD